MNFQGAAIVNKFLETHLYLAFSELQEGTVLINEDLYKHFSDFGSVKIELSSASPFFDLISLIS